MNQDQSIIALGEALCRCRALTDAESRMLERAIRREDARDGKGRAWSQDDDDRLLKAIGTVKARVIAESMGRTVHSIHKRTMTLRKAQRATQCVRKQERRMEA